MGISDPDRKLLWTRAGDQCAFPGCPQALTADEIGPDGSIHGIVLGHEAHIVADSDNGPRANPSMPVSERHAYPNRILLCPTHHNQIDKEHGIYYAVSDLHEMKLAHEQKVRQRRESQETGEQRRNRIREERLLEAASMSRARLITRWVAVGVEPELAEELADDENVGVWDRLHQELPETGVVILEGGFGAGKSVISERVHLDCIKQALINNNTPAPLYIKAQTVSGSIEDLVRTSTDNGSRFGVRLTIDGLDEPGPNRAHEILDEVETLVRAWPNSRAIVSVRPGLVDPENRTVIQVPPLEEAEAVALVERLGAHSSALDSDSADLHKMLRLPLFAIIAAMLYRTGSKIPRSEGAFLEALARETLKKQKRQNVEVMNILKGLARLTLEASGAVPAAELEGSEKVGLALETRLVVRSGRAISFALPILEQYFAAESVLHDGLEDAILEDPLLLDKWRYALLMATTIGSWQQATKLLCRIVEKHPGLASWLVANAIPNRDEDSQSSLPSELECGRRIRSTLASWLGALREVAPFTLLTRSDGSVRTVGVSVSGNHLIAALGDSLEPDVTGFPAGFDPFFFESPDGTRWRPGRGAHPPADFPAWPWRWSLDWIARSVESILSSYRLTLPDCEPFERERRWALARAIVQASGNSLHRPIDARGLLSNARNILAALDSSPIDDDSRFWISKSKVHTSRVEIMDLIATLEERCGDDGLLHRPYPIPDEPMTHSGWISDFYRTETLKELVQQVYSAALNIYKGMVDNYFPRLAPMLGLACSLPVLIRGEVSVGGQAFGSGLNYHMEPLPLNEPSRVEIMLERPDAPIRWDYDTMIAEGERIRRLIATYHPHSQSWAHLRAVDTVLEVFRDRPATYHARAWLWQDLHALHLVHNHPPVIDS